MAEILIANGSSLVNPQRIASTTDASSREQQHVRIAGGVAPANESGTLSAAQPTPGAAVAGGTVGGAADYSSVGNVTVAVFGATHAGYNLLFEGSPNGGTNWFPIAAQDEASATAVIAPVIPTNSGDVYTLSLFGFNRFRVRATAFTSGTLSVIIAPGSLLIEPVVASVQSNPAGALAVSYQTAAAGVGQATVTEALLAMTGQRDLAAIASASTFLVPVGKTFRVLGATAWARNGAATATMMAVNIRAVKTGTVTATTGGVLIPLQVPLANVVGNTNRDNFTVGSSFIELLSGWSFGVSAVLGVASASTVVGVSLYGIEY